MRGGRKHGIQPSASRASLSTRVDEDGSHSNLPLSVLKKQYERPHAISERKKTDNPREGWEDGTPPPHRDFKERGVVR